jgi:prevent-host-death family protein
MRRTVGGLAQRRPLVLCTRVLRVGIRELRNDVAAVVRRAAAGERIVVTVDGRPTAQLGPIEPAGTPTLDDLIATGAVVARRRRPRTSPPDAEDAPIDARSDWILDDIRGG